MKGNLSRKNQSSPTPTGHTPAPFQPRPFAPVPEAQTAPEALSPDSIGAAPEVSFHTFTIQDPSGTSRQPIQPKLTIGAPNDPYEQEADRVASQVVQHIHAPSANQAHPSPAIQRLEMPEEDELQMKPLLQRNALEEDELQMKPMLQRLEMPEEDELQMKPLLQRNALEEDELQMKPMLQRLEMPEEDELQMRPATEAVAGGPASESLESAISQARGSGQTLDLALQQQMGQAMGADFSGVTIHTDTQSDQLNRSIQAKAFTTGQDIFFRQGAYQPSSRSGQELIAHELTHVVQQRGNQLQRFSQVSSMPNGSMGFHRQVYPRTSAHTMVFRKEDFISASTPCRPVALERFNASNNVRKIQRKTIESIEPLDDSLVSKSSFFQTSNKTEDIQKKIKEYNKIPLDDKNYGKHIDILYNLMKVCRKWLHEHEDLESKKDKDKSQHLIIKKILAIKRIHREAGLEKARVEEQSFIADNPEIAGQENVFTEKMLGSKKIAVTKNIGASSYAVGNAVSMGTTGEGVVDHAMRTSIFEKIKLMFSSAKDGAEDTAKEATTQTTSVGILDWLSQGAIPVLFFALAVKGFIDAIKDRKALSERKKALEQKTESDDCSDEDRQLAQDVSYGYAKVFRRFISAIYELVSAGIDLVTTVIGLIFPGFGTAIMGLIKIGKTVLNGIKALLIKGKGVYKYIVGTRGKHRTESAKRIVAQGRQGNEEALKLLMGLLRKSDIKTTREMQMYLREKPDNALIKQVAEKLRSQA